MTQSRLFLSLPLVFVVLILVNPLVYGFIPSSPLDQFNSGVSPQDIRCSENFILVMKLHDNSPSCVKPVIVPRLLKQDWILASYNNTSSKGFLTGYITYYPCKPVERSTDLPCTGNARNYTVNVYSIGNKTIADQTNSDMFGIYKIELETGMYNIATQSSSMFHNQTKSNLVKIETNRTTIFNITIDLGIR